MATPDDIRLVILAGGVGGAKMVDGFAQILSPEQLTVIVNTGDDFNHLGLTICPDLDTIVYTLAGLANPSTGWGRADETWHFLETLQVLGGPTWFKIGDRDLALHIHRSDQLRAGRSLSEVTRTVCHSLGVEVAILPMSDQPIRTQVETDEGVLPFQEYFVALACEPKVRGFKFEGAAEAQAAPGVEAALAAADLVVLAPSNPWVSLDPILAVPGLRHLVARKVVIGVSPIVEGKALKGPAAKMFTELGVPPTAAAVAERYADLLHLWVIDELDATQREAVKGLGIKLEIAPTIMRDRADRRELARRLLLFAGEIEAVG